MGTSFEAALADRNAADYAEFLMPHLAGDSYVLDVGCGSGTISLGVAQIVGRVIGVDLEEEEFADARSYATEHGIGNVEFRADSVYSLGFPDDHFDACLCHSMLETLRRPLEGLQEIKRALKPGGVLGVACVEYGGLTLAGPNEALLRRFYAIREQLWQLEDIANPFVAEDSGGLLTSAGFDMSSRRPSTLLWHGRRGGVLRAICDGRLSRRLVRQRRPRAWTCHLPRPRRHGTGLDRVVGVI